MTIADIITLVNSQMDNTIETSHKIRWINEMEQSIYRGVIGRLASYTTDIVASQETYSLSGFSFSQIRNVVVNGTEYEKLSLSYNDDKSYYSDGGDLVLNPIPSTAVTDGLKIYYLWEPTLKTSTGYNTETPDVVDEFGFEWLQLYEYYLYSKICIWKREFGEANNYTRLYNELLAQFQRFVFRNKPGVVAAERQSTWRTGV